MVEKDRDADRLVGELAAMGAAAASTELDRRTFIKGAAGAAATFGFLIAPALYSKPTLVVGGTTRDAHTAPHSVAPSHTGTHSKSKHDEEDTHITSPNNQNSYNQNNNNDPKKKKDD